MALGGGISSPTAIQSRPDSPNFIQITSKNGSLILSWDSKQIEKWLADHKLEKYGPLLAEQCITSGAVLLQLTEDHFKEMGVTIIGHRLALVNAIDKLRIEAGFLPSAKFVNVGYLLEELESVRSRRCLQRYPKRIILVRHAESQGNIDNFVYSHTPDAKLQITAKGRIQAKEAGRILKELLGSESLGFYVSPFVRSKQTYEEIRTAFTDDQVLFWREDPRIREQEWGNFQTPEDMPRVMAERRRIGAFYYRFPTGESGADVYDRVSNFLESLYRDMAKGKCGENAIIVSHGLFCRLFLTRFYRWPVDFFHRLWNFKNCEFAVMELQSEGWYKLITELMTDPA